MKIAKVFPTRTSMSPIDQDCYFDSPGLFVPEYDKVHISVAFTWDIEKAYWLKNQWERIAPVKIGGVAIDGEGNGFTPGLYLRKGITITSRGCPNRCPWCFINRPLKELKIQEGNNVIDNNLLACSKSHLDKVFRMLRSQHGVKLSGGLEAARINNEIIEELRSFRLRALWIAYDDPHRFNSVKRAMEILSKYFSREKLFCYVLIGYGNDTMDKAEGRLRQAWELGAMPFAMLYRDRGGGYSKPEKEWRKFQRCWVRPAYIKAIMRKK